MEHLSKEANTFQNELKSDPYLQAADWNVVSELVGHRAFEDLITHAKETLDQLENENRRNSTLLRIKELFKKNRKINNSGELDIE